MSDLKQMLTDATRNWSPDEPGGWYKVPDYKIAQIEMKLKSPVMVELSKACKEVESLKDTINSIMEELTQTRSDRDKYFQESIDRWQENQKLQHTFEALKRSYAALEGDRNLWMAKAGESETRQNLKDLDDSSKVYTESLKHEVEILRGERDQFGKVLDATRKERDEYRDQATKLQSALHVWSRESGLPESTKRAIHNNLQDLYERVIKLEKERAIHEVGDELVDTYISAASAMSDGSMVRFDRKRVRAGLKAVLNHR